MAKLILRSMYISKEQWAALANTGQGNASKAVRDYADELIDLEIRRSGCCASYVFDGTHHKDCRFYKQVEVPPKRKRRNHTPPG